MKTSTALVIVGAGAVGVALYFYDKKAIGDNGFPAFGPPTHPDLSQNPNGDPFVNAAEKIPVFGKFVTAEKAAYNDVVKPVTDKINKGLFNAGFQGSYEVTVNPDGTVNRKFKQSAGGKALQTVVTNVASAPAGVVNKIVSFF